MVDKRSIYIEDIMNMRNYINSAILKDKDILKVGDAVFSNIRKHFAEADFLIINLFSKDGQPGTELSFKSNGNGTKVIGKNEDKLASIVLDDRIISKLKSRKIFFIKNIRDINGIKYFKYSGDNGFVSLIAEPLYISGSFRGVMEVVTKEELSITETEGFFFNELANSLSDALSYYLLLNELEKVNETLRISFSNVIELLISLIELKDRYTLGHSINVRDISVMVARQLELEESAINEIGYAAALHDIGKIAVPENILNKPSRLTVREFDEIKRHPVQGAFLVANIPSLKNVGNIILHHHERYDGNGYPMGLCGDKIPLGSRIIAVADTYDAMTSERSYRSRMTEINAINIIKEETGFQFDPQVVEAFLAIIFKISKKKAFVLRNVLEDSSSCRGF
ncbi:MAG: HD domain-containing protein [Actinobacteria bacterium]|nr:HD domain-containing protein [Actinomycetota bacterium]